MPYKYFNAAQAITYPPKQAYEVLAQQTLDELFYDSSSWYTIEEETSFASGEYQDVDVRINNVVDANTGERITDDFKKILFRTLQHPVELGKMYKFDDNYWVTINVEKTKTLYADVTVRRCNNVLRWIDEVTGGLFEVPCVLGYLIKENRDYSTAGSALVVPSGMIDCFVQFNSMTNRIKPNQRFLFGNSSNWIAYRLEGGGLGNFNNMSTLNNMSVGLLRYSLAVDYVNLDTDDIVNGIADVETNVYTLELNQSSISGTAGQSVQLRATVTLNDSTVSRDVIWESSNDLIAIVNSSGLVTFVANGSATITCSLANNASVNDTCSATVSGTPVDNYQVVLSPNSNYILEGAEKTWTVYLYQNGVQQVNAFVFTLDSNTVPTENYTYTVIGNNSFKVENHERFLDDVLEITATSGSHSLVIPISLKGAW